MTGPHRQFTLYDESAYYYTVMCTCIIYEQLLRIVVGESFTPRVLFPVINKVLPSVINGHKVRVHSIHVSHVRCGQ